MDTITLTDRYVSAVTRNLPERQREDVARELRASIADQLDARAAAGETTATAERDTIVALGDPEILAAGYADRPLRLIGPRYFLEWKRLLILLLWIVPAAAAVGVLIGKLLDGAAAGEVIGTTVFVTTTTIVHVCFWVTLVFAVLERTTGRTGDRLIPWTIDSLPDPKQNGATLVDLIAAIVLLVALAALMLWDLAFGFVPGERVSFLASALWPTTSLILFTLMAVTIGVAVLAYRAGRLTYPLATVNALVGVAVVVTLLSVPGGFTDGLLNRAFFDTVIPADSAAEVHHVLGVVTWVFVGGIVVWSAIDGFLKARRAQRAPLTARS